MTLGALLVAGLGGCSLVIGDIPGALEDSGTFEADASSRQSAAEAGASGDDNGMNAPSGPGDARDARAGDAGGGDAPPSDGPFDASLSRDSGRGVVPTTGDAMPHVPDVGPPGETDPCDHDGDGVESEACDGTDCNDDDADVHPGQVRFFVEPSQNGDFDYNCDGSVDREHPEPLSCGELTQCDTTTEGFTEASLPRCGDAGDWGRCVTVEVGGLPTGCRADVLQTKRAACH